MKRILPLLLAAAAATAQWPDYKSAKVPRTPDGKADLAAPTPRTAEGVPDLSGVWEYTRPPGPPLPESRATPVQDSNLPASVRTSQFWNLGASFEGGLPFQPWADALHKERVRQNSKDNPDAHCLPLGVMQLHTHSQPRKIIQTRDVIVILYEANGGIRQIFTDGRLLPKDPLPWWFGYSTGRWIGDTLVVESASFRDLGWLDVEGSPLTESGKIIERFRRPDFGRLEIEVTIDDPKAYTKPWTVTVYQRLMPDTELIEFVCLENEKSVIHMVGN